MSVQFTYDELLQKCSALELSNKRLKKFEAFVENVDDGIAFLASNGQFLEVNAKLCSTLGYSRKELLRRQISELHPPELHGLFLKSLRLAKEQNAPSHEIITLQKNDHISFFEITISASQLHSKALIQLVIRDVTNSKQREVALDQYEQIFSLTRDLVSVIDKNYIYQMVNASYSRNHNKRNNEIVGRSVADLHGEEVFLQSLKPQIDRCLAGKIIHFQMWVESEGVGRRCRDVTYTPYRLSDGSIIGIVAVIHDSTDLKLAEEQRELERERLNNILDAVPDGVYIINQECTIEYVNPVMVKAFGPVKGQKCFEYLHNRTEPCIECAKERAFAGKSMYRTWHSTTTDNAYEIFDSPLKNKDGALAKVTFFRNVTAKILVNEALKENQLLLEGIINNSSAVIYVKDVYGKYVLINDQFSKIFNITNDNIIGKTDFYLFPGEQARKFQQNDQKVLKECSTLQVEETVKHDDGNHIYVSIKFPLFNADGLVYATAGISTDISEYKKLENELRENNARLTALINASPDIIHFKDAQGKWLLANEAGLQLFQLAGVEYHGKTDAELAPYSEFYREAFLTCMDTDEEAWKKGRLSREEEIIPTPEGGDKVFDIVKIPLFQNDGSRMGLVVQGHDITARLQIEKKICQEIAARQQAAEVLQEKAQELEEANITLRVLLNKQQDIAMDVQQNVLAQLQKTVLPYIALLRESTPGEKEKEYLAIITEHLQTVGSSFIKKLSNPDLGLTQKEILVADMVRQGKKTKEIAKLLNLQPPSVETYRNRIRKKMNLLKKNITLSQYLNATFTSD